MPAYIVFGDASLRDMARLRPTSTESFAEVRGVGVAKLRDYGEVFLEAIRQYCTTMGVATDIESDQSRDR